MSGPFMVECCPHGCSEPQNCDICIAAMDEDYDPEHPRCEYERQAIALRAELERVKAERDEAQRQCIHEPECQTVAGCLREVVKDVATFSTQAREATASLAALRVELERLTENHVVLIGEALGRTILFKKVGELETQRDQARADLAATRSALRLAKDELRGVLSVYCLHICYGHDADADVAPHQHSARCKDATAAIAAIDLALPKTPEETP